ncbi:MAG TPA: sigma-70 family RNA polymerase sigma factor [Candidatus Cybelea sp.]|nr:sigma-70 family RNA polymerase sigma factor [Candidatus Cybelea sp.]
MEPAEPPAASQAHTLAERAADDWSSLMARAQDGDRRAYAALLKGVVPYVRALARRLGCETDEIEDAVQDVLLTVHTVRHTYDPARPFAPWLAAIARHRVIDRQRRRFRRLSRETPFLAEHETISADPSNSHEDASERRRLNAAIAALPANQRQAIEMLKLREVSLKAAAAMSGRSETALKVSTHRAIKRLRTLLSGT